MRYILNVLFFYLFHTVVLSKTDIFFPDLLLVLLAVQVSAFGARQGLWGGMIVGFFKSVFSFSPLFDILFFSCLGTVYGLIPAHYFLNRKILVLFNYFIGWLGYFIAKYLQTYIFIGRFQKVSIMRFSWEMLIGLGFVYLFYVVFLKLLGLKKDDR